MYKFFQGVDIHPWTLMSTPVFLLAFVILTIVIFKNRNRNKYVEMAHLPLEDGEQQ